jgi:hypothetical protein
MAILLSLVARLEEFSQSVVEKAGGQEVVQYRGQILPLIRLTGRNGESGVGLTRIAPTGFPRRSITTELRGADL